VKWPQWPEKFDVEWDLEPLPKNVSQLPKKGAA